MVCLAGRVLCPWVRDSPNVLLQQVRALAGVSAASLPAPGTLPAGAGAAAAAADVHHAPSSALSRWLPAAAAASAAVAAAVISGAFTASCEAPPAAVSDSADDQVAAAAQLQEWLRSQGADVSKVQIKPSQAGPGAGLGMFATASVSSPRPGAPWWSWLWPKRGGVAPREPTTLASFPLGAAVTARTACEDPQLGKQFSWMLDKQLLDERTAVMVYLIIERLRGDKSRYAPWICSLPRSFDVPITFSDADMAELRGTTLARAVTAVSRRMRDTWARLEAPLGTVAQDLGLPRPTWDDWVWAYCVWWSRGQSLPVPESGSATRALAQHSSNGNGKVHIMMVEGLVPGLDFANHRHSPPPQCWWEVVAPERPAKVAANEGPASTSGPEPSSRTATAVRLQLHSGASVRPGDELYISYGDKSNEELLMLYGFALPHNPHEHLMLFCPLPPQTEWDDVMHARMELLQAYGLRPQFFLPHPDQVSNAGKGGRGSAAAEGTAAGAASGAEASTANVPPLVLPGDVLDTLEVFVLNFQELAVRSKLLQAKMEERRAARAAGSALASMSQHSPVLELGVLRTRLERMSSAELKHYQGSLGMRMATITAFIRLLEIKVMELEGAEGTGSLEQDEQLLATMEAAAAAAPPPSVTVVQGQQEREQQEQQQRERRLRASLVYRVGQKQLARAWLVRARGELQSLLALMRDMQGLLDGLERSSSAKQ